MCRVFNNIVLFSLLLNNSINGAQLYPCKGPAGQTSKLVALYSDASPTFDMFRNENTLKVFPDQWQHWWNRSNGAIIVAQDSLQPSNSKPEPYDAAREEICAWSKQYPKKIVINHFIDALRTATFNATGFQYSVAHWMWMEGARVSTKIPAAKAGDITNLTIRVPKGFLAKEVMPKGRYAALTAWGADGRPDWNSSEIVMVESVYEPTATATVRRGQVGTVPIEVRAENAAYLASNRAPHTGGNGVDAFNLNFALNAPRDRSGKRALDVFAEEIASVMGPGGLTGGFHGISFDTCYWQLEHVSFVARSGERLLPDCDGDSVGDGCIFDGHQTYGLGQWEKHRRIREALGDGVIMIGKGYRCDMQRSIAFMNGMESEGWPSDIDKQWILADWSGGVNRIRWWHDMGRRGNANRTEPRAVREGLSSNARASVSGQDMRLSHIITKYPDASAGNPPHSTVRAMYAASQLLHSSSGRPPLVSLMGSEWLAKPDYPISVPGIPDEMSRGRDNASNWLGAPITGTVRVADAAVDLLGGSGVALSSAFARAWTPGAGRQPLDIRVGQDPWPTGDGFAGGADNYSAALLVSWRDIPPRPPAQGGEIPATNATFAWPMPAAGFEPAARAAGQPLEVLISFEIRCKTRVKEPNGVPRLVWLTNDGLVAQNASARWVDGEGRTMTFCQEGAWFNTSVYYRDVGINVNSGGVADQSQLKFTIVVEGSELFAIRGMRIKHGPDAMARAFEGGAVLANPSHHDVVFNLTSLLGGDAQYKRLDGFNYPDVNNGSSVDSGHVLVPPLDGLFLQRA